jgi:hypothetical protein
MGILNATLSTQHSQHISVRILLPEFRAEFTAIFAKTKLQGIFRKKREKARRRIESKK